MEDVTDYGKNNDKPITEQRFRLEVSYEELCAVIALAQNPHPAYMQDSPHNERIFKEIFIRGNLMKKYINSKNESFEDADPLGF